MTEKSTNSCIMRIARQSIHLLVIVGIIAAALYIRTFELTGHHKYLQNGSLTALFLIWFYVSQNYLSHHVTSVRPIMSLFLFVMHVFAGMGVYTLMYHPRSTRLFLEMMLLYQLGGLGITAGSHRLWAHRAYKAKLPFRMALMLMVSLANQGSIYHWSRDHRTHHKHSDTDADPHNASRGFWYSHCGWLILKKPATVKEAGSKIDCSDLLEDSCVQFQRNCPWFSGFVCYIAPMLYAFKVYGEPVTGFLILGALRWIICLHATWCVNSVAHLRGDKPYDPNIYPSESWFTAIVAVGEGWHNWHHTYPRDYACSELGVLQQWNPTKFLIDCAYHVGLVTDRYRSSREWAMAQVRVKEIKKKMDADYEATHNATSPWDSLEKVDDAEKLKEIYATIPKHCFERSVIKSTSYLMMDICVVLALVVTMKILLSFAPHWSVKVLLWIGYMFVMGTALTSLWVVGHECGHQAYSEYPIVNDVIGFILHSALLVPYFSWQYSHGKHHKYTNHLIKGETHVPSTKKGSLSLLKFYKLYGEDAFVAMDVFFHLVLGWPLYLFLNATGGRETWDGKKLLHNKPADHFRGFASNQLFPPAWRLKVNVSSIGVLTTIAALVVWGMKYGWMAPVTWYMMPYLVVNAWLVLYTWLHHSHPDVPHYGTDSFSFLRGALSTVDRPYPLLIDLMHHHIGSTHVLHHVNSRIPHYNAKEATEAIKPILGDLYRYEPKTIYKAVLEISKTCNFVEGLQGVQFFKSIGQEVRGEKIKVA